MKSRSDNDSLPRLLGDNPPLLAVAHGLRASAQPRAAAGPCLDEIELAEAVEGRADPAGRERQIAHLAACGHCRAQLTALAGLLGDQQVRTEVRHLEPAARRRVAFAGLAVAATAVLVLGLPRFADERPSPHRAPTITAAAAPLPLTPIGAVASVTALQWAPVAGADRYRVTLFDAAGAPLYEAQTPDTTAALPDSLTLAPGHAYRWQVEARTSLDRWSSSEMAEFRIAGRSP